MMMEREAHIINDSDLKIKYSMQKEKNKADGQ